MRERINRLARGIIDSESPQVTVEPKQVEESVPVSPKVRGELLVASSNHLYIKGLAYSSNPRVTIVNSAVNQRECRNTSLGSFQKRI